MYRFKLAVILLSFLSRDCATPRKLKNHFHEDLFQWNLAQSIRSSIETHNWNKILKFFTLGEFYRHNFLYFNHMPKYPHFMLISVVPLKWPQRMNIQYHRRVITLEDHSFPLIPNEHISLSFAFFCDQPVRLNAGLTLQRVEAMIQTKQRQKLSAATFGSYLQK